MSEGRPNAIVLAQALRELGTCWDELDRELTRKGGSHSSAGASEHGAPLDLSVLDAKRAIDALAYTYAKMLMEESDWEPPRGADTPALLDAIARRIGHFTHHDDALVAYEFAEDVERVSREAWAVARPNGVARIPIGDCFADGCKGRLRVTIDRDRPMDDRALALWQPTAICDEDRDHVILARLYAEGQNVRG